MATYAAAPTAKDNFAQRFMMWLYIVTMVMIFAGFTSALIVSMKDNIANNSWKHFAMPDTFWISTLVIIASSGSLYWAYKAAAADRYLQVKIGVLTTLLLGLVFLTTQYIGFTELYEAGVRFVDNGRFIGSKFSVYNISGSFFMVLTGMHALHVVAGIIVLIVLSIRALTYRINSQKLLGLQLSSMFWHALGALWIYLHILLSSIYQ